MELVEGDRGAIRPLADPNGSRGLQKRRIAMRITKTVLIPVILCAALVTLTVAQELPKGVADIPLSKMKWVLGSNGLESAKLLGDSTQAGPYLNVVKWPPNKRLPAHKHPDDRYGMVVSGVHYVGYGDKFDEKKLHANVAGTFFSEPANTPHFGMTKGEGAVLYFYGIGPSGSTPLE